MKAYVLIQTDGNGVPLAQSLLAVPGVVFAEDLRGAYDAIALARAGSEGGLLEDVMGEIRRLPGVTRALPAPVLNSPVADGGPEPADRPRSRREEAA